MGNGPLPSRAPTWRAGESASRSRSSPARRCGGRRSGRQRAGGWRWSARGRAAAADARHQVVMGGERESGLAPVWRADRSLYVVSDRSGWWNLYLAGPVGTPRALCPREEDFAAPLWQLGTSPYAVLADGRLAVSHGTGPSRLGVLDPETGQLTDVDLPYQAFSPWLSGSGQSVAATAGGPAVPLSVVRVDIPTIGEKAGEAG